MEKVKSILYILESNPHSVSGDFLNGKKFEILIRTFPPTAPCPRGEWYRDVSDALKSDATPGADESYQYCEADLSRQAFAILPEHG
jgi:hypothetical protein